MDTALYNYARDGLYRKLRRDYGGTDAEFEADVTALRERLPDDRFDVERSKRTVVRLINHVTHKLGYAAAHREDG